ncbi:MAG: NADH-quinone oxidoreductase subunit NuoI [Fidelibacterota bacterium]|nr:MAG: NADH-quinone oxidoreductase subunit NuoI [Candidatus Neomarinimicrobiota bacterium]
MATVLRTYEPRFWDRFYIPALLQGLFITLGRIFKRKDTIQYPESKHVPPEGYRGLHRLNRHEDGRIKCVACEMCATACPAQCISIESSPAPWEEGEERYPVKFEIDLLRCIYCGFCEIACPKDAIDLTEIYDFSDYTRDSLVIDEDGLLKVGDITQTGNVYQRHNRGEKVELPLAR